MNVSPISAEAGSDEVGPAPGRLAHLWSRWRAVLISLVLLGAIWFLAPQALDLRRLAGYVAEAAPVPILAAILCQAPRYLGAGFLMSLCTRQLATPAPRWQSAEVALASGAASRLLPVAGAGGIAVRFAYLKRCGLAEPAIAGYFLLQNLLGTASLLLLSLMALAYQRLSGSAALLPAETLLPSLGVVLAAMFVIVLIARRPQAAMFHARQVGAACDRVLQSRLHRNSDCARRLESAASSLATALTMGGRTGPRLTEGLFYSSWTIVGDVASLYLVSLALGCHAGAPAAAIAYAISSVAASAVAMPAGLGVTEGAMVAAYAAFGQAPALSLAVVLVFRAVSFWVPILFGLGAGWHLRRVRAL